MFFRIVTYIVIFFLVGCLPKQSGEPSRDGDVQEETVKKDIREDKKEDREEREDREDRTTRSTSDNSRGDAPSGRSLRKNSDALSSRVSDRHSSGSRGRYSSDDRCEDYPECENICRYIAQSSSQRGRCERLSYNLVEDMDAALRDFKTAADANSIAVHPDALRALLDLSDDIILDLVEDQMSLGDLKIFLAWVAISEDIAEVFKDEDRKNEILHAGFERLIKETGLTASDERKHAMTVSLISQDDTFLSLAAEESNEEAFGIAYEFLQDNCKRFGSRSGRRDCKQEVLCAREYRSSRSYRTRSSGNVCRTSTTSNRRSGRSVFTRGTCYIQGSLVWSYLEELIDDPDDDGDVSDRDFVSNFWSGKAFGINVDYCNKFCGHTNSSNRGRCNISI